MDYSVFRPKKAEKKATPAPATSPAAAAAPAPAPAPAPGQKPPHGGEIGHHLRGFMDPYMEACGGGGAGGPYISGMADHFSSNRRLNHIELTDTRRITFHFNEFDCSDGGYYDAPPWSHRRHHDDHYDDYHHCYGRHPFALPPPPPRFANYMLPPPPPPLPPMTSSSPYYGGGYELPYYSMPPPPIRYPSYFY